MKMDKNFKLIIEYDGTRYHGWQRQREDTTIQGEIEKALGIMTAQHVVLNGSGRTDAGVMPSVRQLISAVIQTWRPKFSRGFEQSIAG